MRCFATFLCKTIETVYIMDKGFHHKMIPWLDKEALHHRLLHLCTFLSHPFSSYIQRWSMLIFFYSISFIHFRRLWRSSALANISSTRSWRWENVRIYSCIYNVSVILSLYKKNQNFQDSSVYCLLYGTNVVKCLPIHWLLHALNQRLI